MPLCAPLNPRWKRTCGINTRAGTCIRLCAHTPHTLWKSHTPVPQCYTAATCRKASHTVRKEQTLTWYLTLTVHSSGAASLWRPCVVTISCSCTSMHLCAFQSSTPTSLCRHGFLLSSQTMLVLFFAPLFPLCFPSLSLVLSSPRSLPL